MDKKIAGLIGAAAALTTIGAAQAAVPAQTQSGPAVAYRDLLTPIPNAGALLKADNQRAQGEMKVADTVVIKHKRHHHHHHHHVIIVHHHHDHD